MLNAIKSFLFASLLIICSEVTFSEGFLKSQQNTKNITTFVMVKKNTPKTQGIKYENHLVNIINNISKTNKTEIENSISNKSNSKISFGFMYEHELFCEINN